VPLVVEQSVDGAINAFGTEQLPGADEEIALDLQVIAGLAPAARIVVYFARNSLAGLTSAIQQAVRDEVNRPGVLSISWGSAEEFWPVPERDALEAILADAAERSVTVVAAAGDALSTAGVMDGHAHVLYPASSPHVLSCGGTRLVFDADGGFEREEVWHEGFAGTGGGVSDVFTLPDYQLGARVPISLNDRSRRRGVPDVAAAAASSPGYRIVLNGTTVTKEGTSAATPLWAALVALGNSRRGRPIGQLHSLLYANPGLCREITTGNNRSNGLGFDAGPGWNACTGLGSPRGLELIEAITVRA